MHPFSGAIHDFDASHESPDSEFTAHVAAEPTIGDRLGSWSLEAPAGAYGAVPAWRSGAAWFDAVMDALSTPEGEDLRFRAHVARDTLLRVARADWVAADANTGRGLATAHETVAFELGMSSKTVQRSRKLLEVLGLAVTIVEGRYLTTAEREAARARHGGHQLRAASLRALTMSKSRAVQNVQLPRRGSDLPKSPVKKFSPKRASARKSPASRASASKKFPARRIHHEQGPAKPRSIAIQRFAHELSVEIPWLCRGRHIGNVASMLERCHIDPVKWTPRALIDKISRHNVATGITVKAGSEQRDPIAYLAWQIQRAIDPAAPTPLEEAEIIAADRAARRAEQQRAREEDAAIMARIEAQRDEIAAIIAASNAEIQARSCREDREINY